MGADLYIQSISDKAREKYSPMFDAAVKRRNDAQKAGNSKRAEAIQKEVEMYHDKMYPEEGYFRDSYNGTSLFRLLDQSWWQDLGPMLNKKGELSPTKAKKLLEQMRANPVPKVTKQYLLDARCKRG